MGRHPREINWQVPVFTWGEGGPPVLVPGIFLLGLFTGFREESSECGVGDESLLFNGQIFT